MGQPLDQRADLYSLGALGYFLLTGVHAYPARAISELRELFPHPLTPPSTLLYQFRPELADIPGELDQLVLTLLRQNPMERLSSASALIERLNTLAGLEPEAEHLAIEGYLQSKAFVGRLPERERLRADLLRVEKSKSGGCVLFEAEPGMGATRLLEQLALETRLGGHTVLSLDTYRGAHAYGAAHVLSMRLLDALPLEAQRAGAAYAPVLAYVSDTLRDRLDPTVARAVLPTEAGEGRMRIQAALKDWFLSVARKGLLCIVVDDLDRLDDESAAFLASLVEEAPRYPLWLVVSARKGVARSASLEGLGCRAQSVNLAAFEPHETEQLLLSVFGETPHLLHLAQRLHQLAGGNPAHLIELAEHLVRTRVARYEEGTWLLPAELDETTLPRTRDEGLLLRVARLTDDARRLGQGLSVHRGEVSLGLVSSVSELSPLATHEALARLVRAGVLVEQEDGYTFVDECQQTLLLEELGRDPVRKRATHRALGKALREASGEDHVKLTRAAFHLLHGGEKHEAGALLRAACIHFVVVDNSAAASVTSLLEEVVSVLRGEGASDYELLAPLAALSVAGIYIDRRLGLRHGEETMRALESTLRLGLARRFSPYLGKKAGLIVALAIAGLSFGLRRKQTLVPRLEDAVVLFAKTSSCLVGLYTMLIDPDTAARYTDMLEPLAALGEDHVTYVTHEICQGFVETNRMHLGRLVEHWERVVPKLDGQQPIRKMTETLRIHCLGGALLAWGSKECWRDGPAALQIADKLDKLGMKLYEMSANQLRFMYYSYQGQSALAEHFRRRVDLAAIQRGAAWQVEIWTHGEAAMLARRTHDTTGCRRAVDALDRVGAEVPSVKIEAARTRGCYLVLRGQYEEGRAFIEALAENDENRIGWTVLREMLARADNGLGEHQRARDICIDAISKREPSDLTFTVMNLGIQIELALAEAGLGNHVEAAEQLERLLVLHTPNEGALTLVALHEARARVALSAGDDEGCRRHIERMEHWARPTAIGSLVARIDRLERALLARQRSVADLGLDAALLDGGAHLLSHVAHLLTGARVPLAERGAKALAVAQELTGAEGGFILLQDATGALSHLGESPTPELVSWANARLSHVAGDATDTDELEEDAGADGNFTRIGGLRYRLSPLELVADERGAVGAIVLASSNGEPRMPSPDVLRTIAHALAG